MVKIYWSIWGFIIFAAAVIAAAGFFDGVMTVFFGIVAFGMVFMGMMSVLPTVVAHPSPAKEKPPRKNPSERMENVSSVRFADRPLKFGK